MKKYLCITIFIMLLLTIMLNIHIKKRIDILETFDARLITEEEIKNELIIAMFVENITTDIETFYANNPVCCVVIYNYEIDILEIEKTENNLIFIKFGVTPQVGAHNPVGYDELIYSVDVFGNIELTNYEHIRDYDIPERFKDNTKQAYSEIPFHILCKTELEG